MRRSLRLTAGSRRPPERPRLSAACGTSALALVLGVCAACRESQGDCLRRARACLEPGPGRADCGLCEAPIDSGHYCAGCQRRISAAVAAYDRRARAGR